MAETIRVTQEDIDNGDSHWDTCPVALALARNGWVEPRVGWEWLLNDFLPVKTPLIVRVFMASFDDGESVAPFEFDV